MTDAPKPDYRDTVFLPKTDFPMRGSLPQKEPELLARWKALDLYGRQRKESAGREKFILHDGPPYANGNIHIGHALNKILKDVVVRSEQMLGKDAPYIPGWDCHGLPIEWKIEEQYRAKGKDKDEVPVLQFRAECRTFAEHWVGVQSEEFQRLGVIGDWGHPYKTMTYKAEAQILREIHKFLLSGLLYRGVKPVMWSVVEKTALAEAEIEYQDHKSTTLWVRFPVVKVSPEFLTKLPNQEVKGLSVVIWTTTPWTIPGNRAIAYGNFKYTLIEVKGVAEGSLVKPGERLLIASDLLEKFCADVKIVNWINVIPLKNIDPELKYYIGSEFKGTICAHPFRGLPGAGYDFDVPLLYGDFVTTDTGTGFVHIAPSHGEDDFNLVRKYNEGRTSGKIPIPETVSDEGKYLDTVPIFAEETIYTSDGKVGTANGKIISWLKTVGALLAKKNITHSYPHSWRSKAPLIFRTTPQWFIALDKAPQGERLTLRQLALDAIEKTEWFPAMGENRIRGMIETRPDWCISRQRAWGVPIALFVHKTTGEPIKDKAVLDRIAAAFEKDGADAWYAKKRQEFLGDKYKAEDYEQVFDIVDVWFESGSTHAFVLDQKIGASEWPNLRSPADLYLEGSDQHRGWFHSSLLESCGTIGRAPYDKVLTHGFTLDEQGRKMSKSLGNVTAPQDVMDKMGADILRLWVVSCNYTDDQRIGPEILKQTGDLYRRFRNTLRYLLGALDGMSAAERVTDIKQMPELERWVLHRLHEMDAVIRADIAKFDFNHMLTALHDFCNGDLSAFYFDVRKDSLYCDRPDSPRRRAARTVLEHIFNHLAVWLAPLLCFTAEEAWLTRHNDPQASVHLQVFPAVPKEWRDAELGKAMQNVRSARAVITGMIEQRRNNKEIGSSLESHATIYLNAAELSLLKKWFPNINPEKLFAELCIVSTVTIQTESVDPDRAPFSPIPMVGITKAPGQKCERCWQVLPEVGQQADYPHLCRRCADAVTHIRKAAA